MRGIGVPCSRWKSESLFRDLVVLLAGLLVAVRNCQLA